MYNLLFYPFARPIDLVLLKCMCFALDDFMRASFFLCGYISNNNWIIYTM